MTNDPDYRRMSDAQKEQYRAQAQHSLEYYRAVIQAKQTNTEATYRYGELSVRSLLILNGGAALALLTLAGSAKTGLVSINAGDLAGLVWYFGAGAGLSVLTSGLAYLSQSFYAQHNEPMTEDEEALAAVNWIWRRLGHAFRIAAMVAWLSSLGLFSFGVWQASQVFNGMAF